MRKEFCFSIVCTMACVVVVWLMVGKVSAIDVGDQAPDFTLTDAISGDTISLADYEGKVVLLDFFATFCYYCINAFDDDLVPLYNQSYADDPKVIFLSINIWQEGITAEELQTFASNHSVEWPILMGSISTINQDYEVTCLPTIFIIDGDGVIGYRYNCGSPGATILKEEIDALRIPLATDTNGDGIVDIVDVFTVAVAFGTTLDDPNWDPAADITNEGVVDVFDVIPVKNYFGKTV